MPLWHLQGGDGELEAREEASLCILMELGWFMYKIRWQAIHREGFEACSKKMEQPTRERSCFEPNSWILMLLGEMYDPQDGQMALLAFDGLRPKDRQYRRMHRLRKSIQGREEMDEREEVMT